ncbi:MAG TPA: non-heme iron oxygenase ferredoxin subunit [Acidimicrobiia bacterium]|nr:non-heme iron oxygenase ferredoxin subunit [Acidimicrobiia bacterium]
MTSSDLMEENTRIDLCLVDEIPEGGAVKVESGDLIVAVFKVGGELYVTDDHCTHGPGSLSEGFLQGYEIECDFHQGCFDIRTGEVTAPPCLIPVNTYPVFVADGRVTIEA